MDWDKVKQQRRAEAKVKMPDTSNSNPKITDDDVNGFLNSIDSATKDVEKYLTEPTYSTRDERSGYRSTIRNQRNKANEIALYVAQNRNKYSNSDEILNYLDNYIESLRGLAADVSKYGDFYSSNFKSEDDYNNYLDSIKKQEELLNFDTAAANKELSGLEAARNNIEYDVAYDTARSSRFGVSARKNIGVDQTERENLDRRISELKQKITLASRAQNAEKLRNNALNDIEFKKYSDQGASIKNPSMRDAEGSMTVFGKPIGGEDIGNIVTYSRDNWKEIAMGGANGGTVQGNAIYKYMTGEEVDIYNYYLAKEGAEKASEYLDSITENLNMRQALGIYDELEDKTALQYVFGVSAGLDQFGSGVRNTVKAIKGDDSYTPASSTQIASGMIREGLADDGAKLPEWMGGGSVGQLGYDAITNTTNNLPSMLVGSIFGPGAGAITMGASVYGNAYSEMINLGYDKNQANSYAALTAASEAGLQYLLGGIASLGGKVSNNVLKRIISNVDNAFAKIAIQYGGEMMSEFTEEYLQDVLDPYFKNLATGENNEVTLLSPDAMYSGILGALNAGAGNATFGAINNVANNSYLNNYYKETYGEGIDSLIQEGLATEKDSKSYSLAEKLKAKTESGEDISGAAIRKLVEANEKQFNNADTAKIESAAEQRLKSLGETGDSAKIAKALTKQVKGEVLSISEQKALDNSKYGQRVANELSPENIRSGNYSSSWAENIGTDRINADLYNLARETAGAKETTATGKESLQVEQNAPKAKQESAGAKVQTSETTSQPKVKSAVQSEFKASESGKTISNITGSESDVAEIVKIKNGEMTLKLENGETVNAKNVSYGSQGEALIYETVAKFDNISAPAADVLVKAYNSSGNISADVYARGIEEAYRYGKYNIPVSEMIERGAFAAELTAEQRNKAYRLGQMFGGKSVAKAQAIRTQSTMGQVKKAVSESKKGRVHFDGNMESLNERQRTSVSALEKISEALGVDFYLFESKEINGKRQGANGWYDPKDGSIHIDIYAGQNGEGTMLFTAAHELTHFIKEWSPAKFKVLANFLMQEYGKKGVSVNELVIAQQEKARRNGREISYDVAYEEVIADSMETMLADGNVMEKLAKLKAKDKTLWEKIKDFITDLVKKIKEVYAGLTPNSEEGQYVAEMVDAVEKLQELFTEGVIEAAENFQTAQETDTKSKAKFSQRKIEEESAEVARLTEQYMAKRKELFQNEEKKRELLKSEEYGKLMDDVVKSGASPESLEAMSTWEKREGLSELSETVKNLEKEVREFYSQVNKAAAEEQKRKEIAAIEASGLSEADYHRKQAVKEFGYTPYFVDAAYILPNGKMLNFSGEKGAHYGSRGQDHRAIGTIFAGNVDGSEAMVKFMQEGNIRIMPEGPSVDISSVEQPTKEQYAVIKKFVREYSKEENFSIDFTDAKGHTVGSYSYEGKVNADRVVNDIKYFFENGETRPDSGIGQFLYSMRDSDGNELSKQQQEYFKDSKVRDEEGNLLVVYHGTRKADFTKFSRNYNFFTDSKDMADSYSQNGELYTGYLDIKNPFTIDAKGEKWSKIPIDTVTKKFLDSYGSSTFKEKGQWRTTPADIVAAIQDGIDEGEFDYDGIIIKNVDDTGSYYKTSDSIIANDYIVFNSKQFKNADNKAPTADPDIRYSDRDSDYMTAVESGDMKTAQRLVDEAAKEAGYSIKAYHGSDRFGFTKFSPSKSDDRISLFFSDSSEVAKSYTKGNEIRMVGKPLKDTPEIIKQAESVIEDYNNGDFDIDGDIYKVGNKYVIEDFSENGDKYVCRTAAEFVQVVELLKKGKGVGATYSTYLKMVNPLKVDAKGSQWNNIDFVPQELQSLLNERKEREDSFYKKQAEIRSYAKENGITMSEAIDKVSGYWELVDKAAEIEEQIEKFREDNQLFKETTTRDISHYAKSHGYDGVQISNVKDIGSYGLRMTLEDTDDPMRFVIKTPSEMSTVYVAFNSEQVKSADPVTYDDNGNVIPLSERFKKENDDIRYSDRDSEYMDAVNKGDMATAQNMVNNAAKESGAIMGGNGRKPLSLYRGTPNFGRTVFKSPVIFTSTSPSVSAGYGGNKGYARQRLISESYTQDDGSTETLIKNAKNVLDLRLKPYDDTRRSEIRENTRIQSDEMSQKVEDVWTGEAIHTLPDMTEELANSIDWVLSLPGAINENIDDFGNNEYFTTRTLENWIDKFDEHLPKLREYFDQHRSELKDTAAWPMLKLVMGYELSDFAIDARYKFLQSFNKDLLVTETGNLVSAETVREQVESAKNIGSYHLYGYAGDNPLVIDGNGAMWFGVPVEQWGGNFTTDDIVKRAQEEGYTSVCIKNINDVAMNNYSANVKSDIYAFFDREQVKSADPVTYDDNGNVIPLSERFKKESEDIRYSLREEAPTFYSLMGKVVDGIKSEKVGANGVIPYLKGKGVKDEEIKWSGIEAFLEGKKSVTKQELQEFVEGSTLQIGEQRSDFDDGETRWEDYTLMGGKNYREMVFIMPNSTYSNRAMRVHWGEDAEGILAHARVQDFETDGGKMLFVEEIQSDWHNEGQNKGYADESKLLTVNNTELRLKDDWYYLYHNGKDLHQAISGGYLERRFPNGISKEEIHKGLVKEYNDILIRDKIPDAPFHKNYHEYVLKRLIREAAEKGYDSIGWTPADIQVDRWSDEYAEGYRIEYDQDIPKFLNKYGKKWGAKVGKTEIDASDEYNPHYTEIWSMPITDAMKESVLSEGQPLFQDRIDIADRNRAVILQNKAERLEKELADLERAYKKAQDYARAEGVLAGQIEQGAQMAKELRQKQESFNRKMEGYEKTISDKRNQIAEIRAKRDELLAKAKAEKTEAVAKARQKAVETQREIITRYQESRKKAVEGRHQTEMRHKIKGVVNELNQLLIHGTKDRHVMIGLQKAVAEALDAVNMDTIGADERVAKYDALIAKANDPDVIASLTATRDRIRRQGDNLSEKIAQLKAAYGDIKNSDDPLVANGYDEVIASKIDAVVSTVGNTPLRAMSTKQLEDVYDMYKMVLTRIRGANESFKSAKKEAISVLGNRVMMEVEHVGGKHPYRLKGSEKIEGFMWNNLKPVYAFEKIGSKTLTEVYNNVRAGEDTFAKDVTEAREFFVKENRKYHYDKWNMDKTFSFKSKTGQSFKLTIPQIMSLYAYSKRNQADKHLELGGFVFDSNIEVTQKKKGIPVKYTVNTATAHNISKETLGDIIGKLTAEQKAFVDEMQDFLSTTMGEKGNEVSLAMYGVKLFKEKHYFPLKSAKQFMFEQNETAGEVKLKNSGFSKETVVNASNPIILSNFMDVWANHVNDMSMYHSFVLPLEDFNRVFNYKTPNSESLDTESVKQFIQNAYGKEANAYIKQLLTDLNGGAVSDPRETTAKRLISNFKKAAVFSSASVVIQQPSAIGRALAIIDPKYFVGGKIGARGHSALWAEVKKYAPVAIIKEMGYFDTNMGRSTVDFITAKEYKGFAEKAKGIIADSSYRDEVLSKAPALADEITWCTIWNAVKRETKAKHKELTPGSEEFLKAAGARFTEVITKTQVYDSILSRSANMRSKSTFMSMWTSFMGEPTTSINMIEDAIRQGKRGNKKYAAKAIGAVFTSMVLNSLLVSLVYAARDDDEDETYLEKYLASLTSEVIEGINPLTYLPFFKDVWSSLQGFDIERADMSLITKLIESTQKAYKVYTEDTEDMTEDELLEHDKKVVEANWSIVDGISSLIGLPVKNLRRDINGAINLVRTVEKDLGGRKTTMGSLADKIEEAVRNSVPILGWGKGESRGDRLYDAIIAGDETYANRIKDSIGDDQKYANMRFATLRDNDPRIKEAAQTAFGGDYAGAKKIAEAIIAEGNFSRNEVFSVISTELTKLKNAGKENRYEEKDKLLFGANDFFNAAKNNNVKDANAIRDELIAKKQDEGYLKWEAINSVESSFTSEAKKSYLDGDITAQKAKDILMKYGGKESVSEAETEIKKWNFELKQGYTWSARARGYRLGDISKQELISAVMDIEGDDEEGAELYIRFLDLAKNNEDIEITSYDASSYFKYAEPAGIEVATYLDYKDEASKCKGEKDEYGNTIRNTKKAQILLVIDALPITNEQKDALYFANGWAQSTLKDAPWH